MIKQILSGKVLLAGLVIGLVLVAVTVAYSLLSAPAAGEGPGGMVSAALTIIPAPTGTPRSLPATLTSIPPTSTLPPTPAPGEFAVGVYVQVTIGEEALNIRSSPGLEAEVVFLAFDAEVFLIEEGPREADGYTWWFLTATYDLSRAGWAVQEFLTVIPSP